jgi:hypothetical protein
MPAEAPVISTRLPSTAFSSVRRSNGFGTPTLPGTSRATRAIADARLVNDGRSAAKASRYQWMPRMRYANAACWLESSPDATSCSVAGRRSDAGASSFAFSPFAAVESGKMWYAVLRM